MGTDDFRILIVDDEQGIRFTLGSLLKKEGFPVDTACDRAEAMERFHQGGYELVFIDIMLGGDSGIDLLREVKESFPSTLVVMFTGCTDLGPATESLRLGAFDYLAKPVRFDTLIAVTRHAKNVVASNRDKSRYQADLDAIFSSVSDAIVMIDDGGRLTRFNAAARNVCGYDDSCLGITADVLGLGCAGACRKLALDVLENRVSRCLNRVECRKADGTVRLVTLNATPVMGEGAAKGVVTVVRDETRLVELENVLQARNRFFHIIGSSHAMRKLYTLTESLASVQSTVLITGESGTGKELFASALHHAGNRRNGPFVRVNCAALSESLLESELFGHTRGAFTGAIADKMGRFEKANGGTIFLDEIGDISSAMQMRLLRVLQEHEIERVGESVTRSIDVRVIAATHQNLQEKVRQGTFRQDLYYRINVVGLELPPLRERAEDIPQLVAHFLDIFNEKFGKAIRMVSDDVMNLLFQYPWPGNVRELEHIIERACIICRSDVITVTDLSRDLLAHREKSAPGESQPLTETSPRNPLNLEEALAMANGNKSRAARLLGISRRTVYRHLGE